MNIDLITIDYSDYMKNKDEIYIKIKNFLKEKK